MTHAEQGLPDAPTGQTDEQSRRRRFLGRWLPALVLVAVVGGLAAVLLGGMNGSSGGSSPSIGGGSANTSGWQSYTDPQKLYSLRIPPGWTAQVSSGAENYGDRTGSSTVTMESARFSDPTYGDSSARVYITVSPIVTDFDRHWYCQAFQTNQNNTTFHGIPAEHSDLATWLFESANAHFQLDVWIPGVLEPPHTGSPFLQPTATPLPTSWIAADRSDINGVLASFRPSNPAALSCS